MSFEPLPAPRSIILEQPDGLLIRIPSKRYWFAIAFMIFWLCGWAFGELAAITSLVGFFRSGESPPDLFLFVWLAGWTLGGAFAVLVVAWMLVGEELIQLRSGSLAIKRNLWGLGKVHEYDLAQVRNLRVVHPERTRRSNELDTPWANPGRGVIAFDYGARTITFGTSIDEAEGHMLVDRLRQRYPFPGDAES
jgi:hypothetical protein